MRIICKYRHGSEDSVDNDVIYITDSPPSFRDAQFFCAGGKEVGENRNIAVIRGGIVVW